jgi:hypothetical protein
MTKNVASGNARVGVQIGQKNSAQGDAKVGVQRGEYEEAAGTPHPGWQVCDDCREQKTGQR